MDKLKFLTQFNNINNAFVQNTRAKFLNPSQPFIPIEPDQNPYNYAFNNGENKNTAIRQLNHFEALDFLANNIDIIKIGLQYKRLQYATYKWRITPIDPTDRSDYTKEIEFLTNFFKKPDGSRLFSRWMSKLLYNYVVYDAMSIYKRRDKAGRLIALDVIDGKTIKPLIDNFGRIPLSPEPAYQQIIDGQPIVNLTTDDLVYHPVNEKIDKMTGCSCVENISMAINTYYRTQGNNLLYFTDGVSTSAGLVAWGDENLSSEQLKTLEAQFNYYYKNPKNKHMSRFVPKGTQIVRLMDFNFNMEFTEHLIKIMCASLNTPQQLFISQFNRSTSQTLDLQQEDDVATGEMLIFSEIFTDIIQNSFNMGKFSNNFKRLKLEYDIDELTDQNLLLQQVIQGVKNGIISPNEGRVKWGYKTKDGLDEPYLVGSTGTYAVKDVTGDSTNNINNINGGVDSANSSSS